MATIPTRDEFTSPNEDIVHVAADAKPDDHNRVQFFAHWLTDQEWVPSGVRGQVFYADLTSGWRGPSGTSARYGSSVSPRRRCKH